MAKITLTGDKELDKVLTVIAAEDGPKSINGTMRKACREASREIVLPRARDLVPVDTGELEDALIVKSIPRSRSKIGSFVGFRDSLFTGDTYYAGFLEYGFTHHRAGRIEADSFLRRPLYENEPAIRALPKRRFRELIRSTNRAA